jgi:hypothetical protein
MIELILFKKKKRKMLRTIKFKRLMISLNRVSNKKHYSMNVNNDIFKLGEPKYPEVFDNQTLAGVRIQRIIPVLRSQMDKKGIFEYEKYIKIIEYLDYHPKISPEIGLFTLRSTSLCLDLLQSERQVLLENVLKILPKCNILLSKLRFLLKVFFLFEIFHFL